MPNQTWDGEFQRNLRVSTFPFISMRLTRPAKMQGAGCKIQRYAEGDSMCNILGNLFIQLHTLIQHTFSHSCTRKCKHAAADPTELKMGDSAVVASLRSVPLEKCEKQSNGCFEQSQHQIHPIWTVLCIHLLYECV